MTMPDTRTERMKVIAEELAQDGKYTQANSVCAITEERDKLLELRNENARHIRILREIKMVVNHWFEDKKE